MTIEPRCPSSWERFVKDLKPLEPREDYQAVFDFQSRWRFARSFTRVEAEGYSASGLVAEGYYVLLRVLLACTAREQLAQVLGAKAYSDLTIFDQPLAQRIRDDLYGDGSTPFALAMQKPKTARAHRQLAPFWNGQHDDVNMVAFAVRHGVAHGTLTPSGIQLKSALRRKIILDLADAVLTDSDERFTTWVDEEVARRGKAP